MKQSTRIRKDDEYGLTPLLWAAWSGHEAVMKLLLERDDVEADSNNELDFASD